MKVVLPDPRNPVKIVTGILPFSPRVFAVAIAFLSAFLSIFSGIPESYSHSSFSSLTAPFSCFYPFLGRTN
jgi:hypothetical protein